MNAFDQSVASCVRGRFDDYVATRRHIHRNPEPSRFEHETSRAHPGSPRRAGGSGPADGRGTGVVADLAVGPAGEAGPVIALRADIDALRLQDQKSCEYRSTRDGICHACATTATRRWSSKGCCRPSASWPRSDSAAPLQAAGIFQPAEETGEGGGLDGPAGRWWGSRRSSACTSSRNCRAGPSAFGTEPLTANLDEVEITITGRGGHSARPHYTDDPVAAAVQLLSAYYTLLPRAVDSRSPLVFTAGKISGGPLCNVIPDRVEILGTLRNVDHGIRATLQRRMREIAAGGARRRGRRSTSSSSVRSTRSSTTGRSPSPLHDAAKLVVGDGGVRILDWPSLGAEDFGWVSDRRLLGAMLRLMCASGERKWPQLHAPTFDIDEQALLIGSQILLLAAGAGRPAGFSGDLRELRATSNSVPSQPGSGAPWGGSAEGQRPFARRRLHGRREMSEGARVRCGRRAVCPSPTRGDCKASGWFEESSPLVPQSGRPLLTTVPRRGASGGKGAKKTKTQPLDPRLPWHVGFEQTESCRQGRGSDIRGDTREQPSPSLTSGNRRHSERPAMARTCRSFRLPFRLHCAPHETVDRQRGRCRLRFAAAAIVVAAIVVHLNLSGIQENEQQVVHTFEVIDCLDEILLQIVNAETGQRGLIITTENDAYLALFKTATPIVSADSWTRLDDFVHDNPVQAERTRRLRERVNLGPRLSPRRGVTITQEEGGTRA